MALAMTRPSKRGDCATFQFKRRTPARLLASMRGERITFRFPDEECGEIEVAARIGEVIKFSLQTRASHVAKLRCALANEQMERFVQATATGPRQLTQREITALAGEFYKDLVTQHEDNPGTAEIWKMLRDASADMSEFRAITEFWSPADQLLSKKGVVPDDDSRLRLLLAVRDAYSSSAGLLARRAEGDYSPDTAAARFPPWPTCADPGDRLAISTLHEHWRAEAERTDRSPSTITGFGRVVRNFVAFLGHDDARRVTTDDVVRYKDKRLIEDGRDPKTVQDSDLVALKAIFQHAVDNRRLATNPALGVRVKVPKKLRRKGYSDEGAARILRAALAHERRPREGAKIAAAKRWVPWLCAFTGARVGEITQLRRNDIQKQHGIWTVRVSPEAGTQKSREEREVPLHPQLITLGFINFVQASADGYLFINATSKADYRGSWKAANNRLGEFTRNIVREERVSAMHGWRHRFITLCRRRGVDSELRRKITGHVGNSVDEDHYGAAEGLYREICKLPNYDLSQQSSCSGSSGRPLVANLAGPC